MLSKAASSAIFESLVWLDLGFNHGLPDHWWLLYTLDHWNGRNISVLSTNIIIILVGIHEKSFLFLNNFDILNVAVNSLALIFYVGDQNKIKILVICLQFLWQQSLRDTHCIYDRTFCNLANKNNYLIYSLWMLNEINKLLGIVSLSLFIFYLRTDKTFFIIIINICLKR